MGSRPSMIGRIAPSPSGRMHLGNAFSSLLAWAQARSQDGSFVLRLEDLDERCRPAQHAQGLLEDLKWLGLDWDGDPVFQTQRGDAYAEALRTIEASAELYPCFCTRADLHVASAPHASDGSIIYPGTCHALSEDERSERMLKERHALRLHVPSRTISFDDEIQGAYSQELEKDCGDFVLRRSDGVYAYQLVCVVDDIHSGVTHVTRGSDLLSSTPRQILLYELLGASQPNYAHHPLLRAPDGRRLSKRDGDLEIAALRERGASPEEIVGYLAFLAGQTDSPEAMSASELPRIFSMDLVGAEDITVDAEDLARHGFVR